MLEPLLIEFELKDPLLDDPLDPDDPDRPELVEPEPGLVVVPPPRLRLMLREEPLSSDEYSSEFLRFDVFCCWAPEVLVPLVPLVPEFERLDPDCEGLLETDPAYLLGPESFLLLIHEYLLVFWVVWPTPIFSRSACHESRTTMVVAPD